MPRRRQLLVFAFALTALMSWAQEAGTGEPSVTDMAVRRRVIDQLVWDDRVDAANVFVRVEDGSVRLSGTVKSYTARLAAGDAARDVYGVRRVDNNLEVSPEQPATMDQYIRIRAVNALELNPSVNEESVDVEVEGGIVTLRGAVDSYWRKLLAADLVEEVPGARSVVNELAVVADEDVRDAVIAREIMDAVGRTSAVNPEELNVTVDDGLVTLTGVVRSLDAYESVLEAARFTQGVREVRDYLTVETAVAAEPRTDRQIRRSVVSQLEWDPMVERGDVAVDVEDGEVTLSGTVASRSEKIAAREAARQVGGVRWVEDELEISEPAAVDQDWAVKSSIRSLLEINPSVDASDIVIRVEDGLVTLDGTVSSFWRKIRAEETAANVAGVIRVTNELAVVPTDDLSDQRIAQEVTDAIDRSAAVTIENVDVRVRDGVVMLSGVVSDRAAVDAAFDSARYTRGVVDVENFLTVEGEQGG